jgi:hypothetical protein
MTVQSQTINHKEIRVNQERIEKRIFELAEFGKDATGKGYRVTYTKEIYRRKKLVYRADGGT